MSLSVTELVSGNWLENKTTKNIKCADLRLIFCKCFINIH